MAKETNHYTFSLLKNHCQVMCQGDTAGYLPLPLNFPLPGETSVEGVQGREGGEKLGSVGSLSRLVWRGGGAVRNWWE